jgi:dephospho-CoA kinase
MIVGITGGIGSGKSTVVKFFQKNENIAVYIADLEARNLMNTSLKIQSKIIEAFGKESYKKNLLNRPYIANLVFKNKKQLKTLNSIVHPEVAAHFQQFSIDNRYKDYVLYENAILFETGMSSKCDFIITVTAPIQERVKRVMSRDSVDKQSVIERMNNQWIEDKKTLQSNYIINNSVLQSTKKMVDKIHNILTNK